MWYSIKKINHTFEITKVAKTNRPIETWFTKVFDCDVEDNPIKINYQSDLHKINTYLKIPGKSNDKGLLVHNITGNENCTDCWEHNIQNGLYKLHIKIGTDFYDTIIFPHYPVLFNNLIETLEKFFCGCLCDTCKDCKENESLMDVTYKTLLYYSLSGNYYQRKFGNALKCVDCNLTEEATCLVLNEQLYGSHNNKKLLKKLLAVFYLSFYGAENYSTCSKEATANVFNLKKIKRCLENLGLDVDCILKSFKNEEPITGDSFIYLDNRASAIIGLEYFIQTSPIYFDAENDQINFIKITKLNLSKGSNNGVENFAQLLLLGNPVYEGQIIDFSDILSNNLVYVSRDTNRNSESWFEWEALTGCQEIDTLTPATSTTLAIT